MASKVYVDTSDREPSTARAELLQVARFGSAIRVVLGWAEPVGPDQDDASRSKTSLRDAGERHPFEIGLELYDPQAGTVASPLRAADGTCLCTTNTVRLTDGGVQDLLWADFPAPASDRVTVLMGEGYAPIEDAPVGDRTPLDVSAAGDLVEWVANPPPAVVGEGAAGEPVVRPIRRVVSSVGGAEDAQIGGNADVSLPADVLFAVDSAELDATARRVLTAAASRIAVTAKEQQVQVVGHTDDQASDAYNLELSQRRARAVTALLGPQLRSAGITLVPSGRGESAPLVPNTDPNGRAIEENRQRNRRVSFVFARGTTAGPVDIDLARTLPPMPPARRTSPSPNVRGSLASVLAEGGEVRIDVTRMQRAGADIRVELAFTALKGRASFLSTKPPLGDNPYGPGDTLANLRLVDQASRRIVSPSMVEDACLCTENENAGAFVGENPLLIWAVFPLPSPDTDKVTVRIPEAGLVADVPVGD
ncbi:MAG: OmpA family protein [Phycicoccus sp.]